ncbi:hypothetical protein LCGC14_3004660, partial [marine sediment metagenome]
LRLLEGELDDMPIDPPTQSEGVYVTTELKYATWYAALRGHGDLYQVEPIGEMQESEEDNFPSYVVQSAKVLRILRRSVWLDRRERRAIMRDWQKADKRAALA